MLNTILLLDPDAVKKLGETLADMYNTLVAEKISEGHALEIVLAFINSCTRGE